MTNQIKITLSIFLFLFLFLTHHTNIQIPRFGNAAKIHIPDDLDDVIDDEEDDEWREWGKKKATPSPELEFNPSDLDKMEPSQIQAQMMKHHTGPLFGFVKLLFGVRRTPDDVSEVAMKWTKVAKTGGLEVKFMGVDTSTVMFTMESGQDMEELKEFILGQPDAYEVKIGDVMYRRPGDPPLEEVIETLKRNKVNSPTPAKDDKDEL